MRYDVFETDLGWVAVVMGGRGVVRATLPEPSPLEAWDSAREQLELAEHDPDALADVRAMIQAYASGEDVDLSAIELDFEGEPAFFVRAWSACRSIPRGAVRSYGWLAAEAGSHRAIRAAGQSMARNRWALLVPCHRVVSAEGALHGFGGRGGLDLKERLLEMEGTRVRDRQVVGAISS